MYTHISFKAIITIQMLRDYYSDVRVTQRLIFESNTYLLNNMSHRVDSFTSHKTPNSKRRQKEDLMDPNNKPNPMTVIRSPLENLSNDLTKPIINQSSSLPLAVFCQETSKKDLICDRLNYIMLKFLQRFRNEHEDDGNIKINITRLNQNKIQEKIKSEPLTSTVQKNQQTVIWFIERLISAGMAMNEKQLSSVCQMLSLLLAKDQNTGNYSNGQQLEQIIKFVSLMERQIESIVHCQSGATFVHFWPQLQGFSQLLNPMLLSVSCIIKNQINAFQKKEKAREHAKSDSSQPVQTPPQTPQNEIEFDEVGDYRCSRISFINLDGYDSPFNLILAKYLNKYVQYMSFPLEVSASLSQQFLLGRLTQDELNKFCKLFKTEVVTDKELAEYYKNLLIFPLSLSMLQQSPDIKPYHSAFVWHIMKEIVLNQIRQYNPSMIIISYSHLINLKPVHFEAILKELAVLTNMKIMLYNNLTHNHTLFSSEPQPPLTGQWWLQRSIWEQVGLTSRQFERISMFMNINSGNYSLDRIQQQENDVVDSFQNYKILGYAGKLFQQISKGHRTLLKSKKKFNEYQKRQILLTNYFKQKKKNSQLSPFYREVIESVQSAFNNPTSNQTLSLIRQVQNQYGENNLQEHFNAFQMADALSIAKQKEKEKMKYITKLPFFQDEFYPYDLIALEFEIVQIKSPDLYPPPTGQIVLSPSCEILLSKQRKDKIAPIYLLNHDSGSLSIRLSNFAGVIDQELQSSVEGRVRLKEVIFSQNQHELSPQQNLCNFNYYETKEYCILFWPTLYDHTLAALHSFAGTTYQPIVTSLIFLAHRQDPSNVVQVTPANNALVVPRSGCTCFQPNDNNNTIFIFGGLYSGDINYLKYQKDITCIQINGSEQLLMENLPQHFFHSVSQNPKLQVPYITAIHNDYVRPRVEYNIHQISQNQVDQTSQIILFGGIGEKYKRPYSLLEHTGYSIKFQKNMISRIKKVKLNNIIPSNPCHPIKMKILQELPVVRTAQNRRIGTAPATLNTNSYSFLSFSYRYESGDERMTFDKKYEVGIRLVQSQCETLHGQLQHKQIQWQTLSKLPVQLELSPEQAFVNLKGNYITLAPQNLFDCTFHFSQMYALVYHQQYTRGLTILAVSDVLHTQKEGESKHVALKQIYAFDKVLNNFRIHVIQNGKIELLMPSGEPFLMIKRGHGGFYYAQCL